MAEREMDFEEQLCDIELDINWKLSIITLPLSAFIVTLLWLTIFYKPVLLFFDTEPFI